MAQVDRSVCVGGQRPRWTRVRLRGLGWLVVAVIAAAACASSGSGKIPKGVTQPDKYLYDEGTKALNDRKWFTAREYFQQLVDTYPQSPFRAEAKLGVGDSYLGERTPEGFVNAEQQFGEFLSYYPTHARADYAQYKIALTHFAQMAKPERDQSATRKTIDAFKVFFERYPKSELVPDAQQKYREARDRLSESIYRVGLFYYRSEWYPGAVARLKEVIETDPQYTYRDAVYYHLAASLARVNRQAEALPYLQKLEEEFEQSEYLEKARSLAGELKASMAAKAPAMS
jgi:outer membrane protein assembly factor BamD